MHSNRTPYSPNATPLPVSVDCADSETHAPRLKIEFSEPAVRERTTSISITLEVPPSVLAIAAANPCPIQVRATFPGCVVTPADSILDITQCASTTFWLTPIARQPIFDGSLDVSCAGQAVQRLPVRVRAYRNRLVAGLTLAAIAAPLLWWWLSAADGTATSAAIRTHVPAFGGITASTAAVAKTAIERVGLLEQNLRIGFWLLVGLTVAALASRWPVRPRTRTIAGYPLLNLNPSPSARMRPLPPYLTAVSAEELARPGH